MSTKMFSGNRFRAGPGMRDARGFTLIEVMVVIVIIGILSSVGVPYLGETLRNQRIRTAVGEVNASIIYARSEAIKRNQIVAMCSKNADGNGCGNTANWAAGWIVFVDADGNGYPGALADILKKQDALAGVTLTGTIDRVSYQRDGRLAVALDVDFVAGASGSASRCVAVSVSGRPNIKPTC